MINSSSRCNVISRAPNPLAVLVAITPWATWQSREPETSITPQPIWARPGSRPRMRIVRLIGCLYPLCSGRRTEPETYRLIGCFGDSLAQNYRNTPGPSTFADLETGSPRY